MTQIGGFQIVEPLGSDGVTTTYRVTGAGAGTGERLHARIYQAPPTVAGTPHAAIDAARFLEIGRRLQAVSEQSDRFLHVKHLAREGGQVILVTTASDFTLQSLIDARVHLSANDLRHLVRQLIEAVREYHEMTGQGHGNLGAPAVHLDSFGDMTETRVRLAEPALQPGVAPEQSKAEDYQALGRLIHSLVEFHPTWAPVRWPVQPSEHWKRVGRSGEKWREFTNRLLDPHALDKGELPGFDELLAALPVEPRDYRKPVGITAAAIIVLVLGGVVYKQFIYNPRLEEADFGPLRDNIVAICEAQDEWLYDFLRAIRGPEPLSEFQDRPALSDDLALLRRDVIDPLKDAVARQQAGDLSYLDSAKLFPELGGTGVSWVMVRNYIRDSDLEVFRQRAFRVSDKEEIDGLTELITGVRTALDQWRAERRAAQTGLLTDFGWTAAATSLDDRLGDPEAPPAFGQVTALLEAETEISGIESRWQVVEQVTEAAPGEGQPAIAQFEPTLRERLADYDTVEAIHEVLHSDDTRQLVGRMLEVARDDGRRIDWDLFRQQYEPPRDWTVTAFSDWSGALVGYYRIEEPSTFDAASFAANVSALEGYIKSLRDCAAEEDAAAYEQRRASVVAMRERLDEMPRIRKHAEEIAAAEAALNDLPELVAECEAQVARVCEPPPDYYDRVTNNTTFASATLRNAWRNVVAPAERLRTMPAELRDEDLPVYMGIRKPIDGTLRVFEHLDTQAFRVESPDTRRGEHVPLPESTDGYTRDLAVQAVTTRRETAIGAVVRQVQAELTAENIPALDTEGIAAVLAAEEEDFDAWAGRVATMLDDFLVRVERRFDLGYTLDEAGADDPRTIGEIHAAWTDTASGTIEIFQQFAPALRGILDRLDRLREIARTADPQTLMAALADITVYERPEVFVAVWNQLGELRQNGTSLRLQDDHQVIAALNAWLSTLEDDARRAVLEQRLREQGHERWTRHFASRTAPRNDESLVPAYEADLALAGDFHVRAGALPSELQWNLGLHAFRDEMRRLEAVEEHEPQAREEIETYQRDVNASYGPLLAAHADAADMLDQLQLIHDDEQQSVDFDEVGPAASDLGFDYVEVPGAVNPARPKGPPKLIAYRHTARRAEQTIELQFILLDPRVHEGLGEMVYVSTEEVSFKTFRRIAEAPNHMDALKQTLYMRTGRDDSRSVRVWSRHPDSTEELPTYLNTDSWIFPDPRREQVGPDYPPGSAPASEPTPKHPAQYISPVTAIYSAAALGCRLPTSSEFQAALEEEYGPRTFEDVLEEARAGRLAGRTPNLCDERVRIQYEHLQELRTRDPGMKPASPELETFFCWPTGSFRDVSGDFSYRGLNDGTLFFEPVDASGYRALNHLYGNVMEWVYDTPEDLPSPIEGTFPVPRDLLRMINLESIGAMGGSALSPPELRPDRRQPINNREIVFREDLLKYQCTDVGFRLVIAGEFDTMAQQVLAATQFAYLDPS